MNANTIKELGLTDNLDLMNQGLTLVDFWAPWCGPCRMMHPVLEEVARRQERAQVLKINVDEHSQLASRFGVSAIPTLVLMDNGREVKRFVGGQSLHVLLKAIESAAG